MDMNGNSSRKLIKNAIFLSFAMPQGSSIQKHVSGVTEEATENIKMLCEKHDEDLAILIRSHDNYRGQKYKELECISPGNWTYREIYDRDFDIVAEIR